MVKRGGVEGMEWRKKHRRGERFLRGDVCSISYLVVWSRDEIPDRESKKEHYFLVCIER